MRGGIGLARGYSPALQISRGHVLHPSLPIGYDRLGEERQEGPTYGWNALVANKERRHATHDGDELCASILPRERVAQFIGDHLLQEGANASTALGERKLAPLCVHVADVELVGGAPRGPELQNQIRRSFSHLRDARQAFGHVAGQSQEIPGTIPLA